MREDPGVEDEVKAENAKRLLNDRRVDPVEYAKGAIAEIERQLLTARGFTKIAKLNRALRRWKLVLEAAP
jgi:hypothetical protein